MTRSRTFLDIVRELDLEDVRRQLAAPAHILIAAANPYHAREAAERYFGPPGVGSWSVAITTLEEPPALGEPADLVLALLHTALDRQRLFELLGRIDQPASVPIVAIVPDAAMLADVGNTAVAPLKVVEGGGEPLAAEPQHVVQAILELAPGLALTLGRRFPNFREAVAQQVVLETSRANAQFALLSSLSSTVPLIGGMLGSTADLLVLTKNQALMLAKLAGLFGRDLRDRVALALELAPVIGGAFLWRGLARTALGFVPTPIGIVPKALVAFSGTYIEGQLALFYYRTGRRPPPELTRRIESEARRLALEVVGRIARWPRQRR